MCNVRYYFYDLVFQEQVFCMLNAHSTEIWTRSMVTHATDRGIFVFFYLFLFPPLIELEAKTASKWKFKWNFSICVPKHTRRILTTCSANIGWRKSKNMYTSGNTFNQCWGSQNVCEVYHSGSKLHW